MKRFLSYAKLLRLPNVFTAEADIFLAVFAIGIDLVDPRRFAVLLISSACLYCAGMAWNDYFDLEQDKKERPFRPLPAGDVSLSAGFWTAFVLTVVGVGYAVLADFRADGSFRFHSTLIAILLVAAILAYDGLVKSTWLGPIMMGLCRFLNVLLGLSAAAAGPEIWGWGLAFVVGVYIVGVTWFARTEARVSDPTWLAIGAILMLAALVLALMMPTLVQEVRPDFEPAFIFPYLLVGYAMYLAHAVWPALNHPTPKLVQAAVKRSVLGLILLDAILATATAGWIGLVILILLAPAWGLAKWVYST